MTKDELTAEANRLITGAKNELEKTGDYTTLWRIHYSGEWHDFPLPAFAAPLMNNGDAKDRIFGFFRLLVEAKQADGVLFGSDTWMGEVTPEGNKHINTPAWRENTTHGFAKLIQLGWIKREEALIITAQSETDILLITQPYRRLSGGRIQLLQARRNWNTQKTFKGRTKMFGELKPENVS
jgi:hypothetical protein